MPFSFDSSRISEIVDGALAHSHRNPSEGEKTLPLDIKIITILTMKMSIFTALAEAEQPIEPAFMQHLNEGFSFLVPELQTSEGKARYKILSTLYHRDLKDLIND